MDIPNASAKGDGIGAVEKQCPAGVDGQRCGSSFTHHGDGAWSSDGNIEQQTPA